MRDYAGAIEILNTTSERYQARPRPRNLRSYCLFELAQEASASGEHSVVLKHLSGISPDFQKQDEVVALAAATSNEIARLEQAERERLAIEKRKQEIKRLEEARLAKEREAKGFVPLVRECQGYYSGTGTGYGPAYYIDQLLKEIGLAAECVEVCVLDAHPNGDDRSKFEWKHGMADDELIVARRLKVNDPAASLGFDYVTTTNRVRITEPPDRMIWIHARCRVGEIQKEVYNRWPERRKEELEDAAEILVKKHISEHVGSAGYVAFILWVERYDLWRKYGN